MHQIKKLTIFNFKKSIKQNAKDKIGNMTRKKLKTLFAIKLIGGQKSKSGTVFSTPLTLSVPTWQIKQT